MAAKRRGQNEVGLVEAAKRLRMSPRKLLREIAFGPIQGYARDGGIFVPVSELARVRATSRR